MMQQEQRFLTLLMLQNTLPHKHCCDEVYRQMAISTLLLFKDASNGEETRRSCRVKEDRSPTATAQNNSGNICISNNINSSSDISSSSASS
jgi:hypothetical protein